MHRHDTLLRHEIVHRGEDALFDLACILRTADQHEPAPKVDEDERLAVRAILLRLCFESGHVDHRKLWNVVTQFFRVKFADEHIACEQVMPGIFGDNADGHPEFRIGADISIKYIDIPVLDVGQHLAIEIIEVFLGEGTVHLTPPNLRFASRFLDNKPVIGGSAGMTAGLHDKWSEMRNLAFITACYMFI